MKKLLMVVVLIGLIGGGGFAFYIYSNAYKPNVDLGERKNRYIYIKHDATFEDVVEELTNKNILINKTSFILMADKMEYKNKVKPGKYLILKEMGNKKLINLLKSGAQEKVRFSLSNIRTREQLAGRVSRNLEADSTRILEILEDEEIMGKYGFNRENAMALFVASEYEFKSWATTSEGFFERMAEEYKKYWNADRQAKAKEIPLTQSEVSTLASIVQQEQQTKQDERPMIAGVYLNRLKKGMKLQADPTVIFAVGDFSIKRVNYDHLNVASKYNTYKNEGLPPGPICVASPNAIDAVLNYRKHSFVYFCAKEDLSGYHNFAASYSEHCKFADKYQKELDRRGIN